MRLPTITGLIDRRILVNYRVDPTVLGHVLPEPFRPHTVNGYGIAGICLIRLKGIRPNGVPSFVGLASENAAHRIAVEWDNGAGPKRGVYIPRRDTSSLLNSMVGGRLFPGVHHRARFDVCERDDRYRISVDSQDRQMHVMVNATPASRFSEHSVFGTLQAASDFFEQGAVGYSPTATPGEYDGLELRSANWLVEPLDVLQVESSFFEDCEQFPKGSAQFDCALLMRGIQHKWHGRDSIVQACCS